MMCFSLLYYLHLILYDFHSYSLQTRLSSLKEKSMTHFRLLIVKQAGTYAPKHRTLSHGDIRFRNTIIILQYHASSFEETYAKLRLLKSHFGIMLGE